MAENGRDISEQPKTTVEKEIRLKHLKDRQNDERQRKLDEIKAQALAAQRFKEQKEMERRRRLEDLKGKEDVRRLQVEERKRAIVQAEQDRLVSILQRNQERDARMESKRRNERSSIIFAFGSSTPRMLDPSDMSASYWGHRRAASIQNIAISPTASSLTRRQSERDLEGGSKKRATSAGGLERSVESSAPLTPAGCASGYVGRRRTDLMPTIPNRESPFAASRKSLNHSPASSRPSSSLSQQSTTSVASSASVRHRPSTTPRRQRPASIAITGVTYDKLFEKKGENKPPLPKTRKSINKDRPARSKTSPVDGTPKSLASPVAPENIAIVPQIPPEAAAPVRAEPGPVRSTDTIAECLNEDSSANTVTTTEVQLPEPTQSVNVNNPEQIKQLTAELIHRESTPPTEITSEVKTAPPVEIASEVKPASSDALNLLADTSDMTASFSKVRINTEEEAKAALAERRRVAREEAERQAEQERVRVEQEAEAELERQRREEEQVHRLVEQQRMAEQERLEEAIKETQRRDEEERLRREEEHRSKVLKEEADKKAREEAERKMVEQAERLKNEEKEREARRKRVEAIMRRTRGMNNANSPGQQNADDKNENENKSESKINGTKSVEENGTKNGKDVDIVDNIIPDDSLKNANTVSIDTINSTDSINSNNTWQASQQYDSLM